MRVPKKLMPPVALFVAVAVVCVAIECGAEEGGPFDYMADRGSGIATSMFGTYIRKGELLVYPFMEYYRDANMEYKPAELGYGLEQDFRGAFRATEGIVFLSYGFTDALAVEIEAAAIDARLEKAPNDPSAMPAVIEESGTGDVEGQVHLRLARENERRPEIFSYFEAVSPQQRKKVLIGTPNWELATGLGVIKGTRWGTLSVRFAADYSVEDRLLDMGEYSIEYLKRLSPRWRVYTGLEGGQDELAWIAEAQWYLTDSAYLKLNNAVGISSKATDWAPEVGIMISLPEFGRQVRSHGW